MSGKKIAVLATGGTIAGAAASPHDNIGYTAAQLGIDQIMASVPGLQGVPLVCEQVAQVDSKDMDHGIWRDLALRCRHWLAQDDIGGLVITHGTDTVEETAFFLHSVLPAAKPVVLTCAMRPATSLDPDGPRNLADAVAVARTPGAQGVVVVCAGVIHCAVDVAKVHHKRLDPFSSGDAGPLGHVEAKRPRMTRAWPPASEDRTAVLDRVTQATRWPRVEIVVSHAGAGGAIADALVAQGARGLVVAATGNGTVHRELLQALVLAQDSGVQVVRASRCAQGRAIAQATDLLPASPLSPVKARIELLLRLLA